MRATQEPGGSIKIDKMRLRGFDCNLAKAGSLMSARVWEAVPHCWMCESLDSPVTREHIFLKWLVAAFGAQKEMCYPIRHGPRGEIFSERAGMPVGALTSREVCQSCNNGWMSVLEGAVKQVLTNPPASGSISGRTSQNLARWFTKTAIMLNVSMPYRLSFEKDSRHKLSSGMPTGINVDLFRVPYDFATNEAFDWLQNSIDGLLLPSSVLNGNLLTVKKLMEYSYYCVIRIGGLCGIVYKAPGRYGAGSLHTNAAVLWGSHRPGRLDWNALPHLTSYKSVLPVVYLDAFKEAAFGPLRLAMAERWLAAEKTSCGIRQVEQRYGPILTHSQWNCGPLANLRYPGGRLFSDEEHL